MEKISNFITWLDYYTFDFYQRTGLPREIMIEEMTESNERIMSFIDLFFRQFDKKFGFTSDYLEFLRAYIRRINFS